MFISLVEKILMFPICKDQSKEFVTLLIVSPRNSMHSEFSSQEKQNIIQGNTSYRCTLSRF